MKTTTHQHFLDTYTINIVTYSATSLSIITSMIYRCSCHILSLHHFAISSLALTHSEILEKHLDENQESNIQNSKKQKLYL
jgi:hypothetical protein